MRLKLIVFILLFSGCLQHSADTPGKVHMEDSKVTFQDLNKSKDYDFHWFSEYGAKGLLFSDTTVIMPGSNGRPGDAYFWAVDKTTGKSTDSIFFSNHYDPDYVVILKGISSDSLKYKKAKLSNGNASGDEDKGGLGDLKNQQLLENARALDYSRNTKYLLLIGLPVVALIIMVIYFKRRHRAKRHL